jgi:hypothetical protein
MVRKTVYISRPAALAFVLFWILLLALIYGFRFSRADKGEFRSVTNEQFNFSVTYPARWRAHIYDEAGFRGQRELRLRIFQSQFGSFAITVSQQASARPTVEDVAAWGIERINETNESLQGSGTPKFDAQTLLEDKIAGHRVLRRKYSNGQSIFEEVYIARDTDMIIITLNSSFGQYEGMVNEFNQIVESFRPLE